MSYSIYALTPSVQVASTAGKKAEQLSHMQLQGSLSKQMGHWNFANGDGTPEQFKLFQSTCYSMCSMCRCAHKHIALNIVIEIKFQGKPLLPQMFIQHVLLKMTALQQPEFCSCRELGKTPFAIDTAFVNNMFLTGITSTPCLPPWGCSCNCSSSKR